MAKVVIFGLTEKADQMFFYLKHDSPHQVVAFTVDRSHLQETSHSGLPVVPFEEVASLYPPSDYQFFVAILYGRVNRVREEKYLQVKAKGYKMINYISSKAHVWPDLAVGENSTVLEGSTCQPFVTIGNNVLLGTHCSIGHNVVIKDHCFLSNNVTILGGAIIEPYCFLGGGSVIRNDLTVAAECVIGAGTTILEPTQEKGVYKASPVILLPKRSNQLGRI